MANTLTSLQYALKYVQDNQLNDLKPNSSIVYDMAPMSDADLVGRKYLCPTALSFELGFTFGDGTAFTYNDDVAAVYGEVTIDPTPVVLKTRIAIELADRLMKSDKSVLSAVAIRAAQMKKSLMKMAEIEMLHGRVGVGVISGNPATPTATTATVIFTAASWAPGVWNGMEGALLEVRNGATKINSNTDVVLVSIDYDNKTLNVSGNASDMTALDDTHTVYFKGAYAAGQYGIKYQLDTLGSVFGIDNSVYALAKAQEHSVSGALTMEQILKGRAKACSRGGLDEDAVLLVSAITFENLNADLGALRVLDDQYNPEKVENGARGIVYHGQGGATRIVAHPMMKEGEAFLFPEKAPRKIGSTDITFQHIDGSEATWIQLEGSHGYQLTGRYSFQVWLPEPAKCVLYTGIVNT